jgi:arsenite/tail-anchored protein-transporting ATPase
MMMIFMDKWRDYSIFKKEKKYINHEFKKEVFFVMGKGGTGKTTTSAALGMSLAGKGKKVLLVSLDPAHNLGDVLDKPLGSKTIEVFKNLYAQEIDLDKEINNYLNKTMEQMKSLYAYLQIFNLDQFLNLLNESPGIEEFAILEAMNKILKEESTYDYIIFDTAPTGITLKVLNLPELTQKWIEKLIRLRIKILNKRKAISKIKGPKYIFLGKEKIELPYDADKDKVLEELNNYYAEIRWINNLLRDNLITTGIMVMNPDRLSALESRRAFEKLSKKNFPIKLGIINRIRKEGEIFFPVLIQDLIKDYNDYSWFNQAEIDSVDVEGLRDIGDRIIDNVTFISKSLIRNDINE